MAISSDLSRIIAVTSAAGMLASVFLVEVVRQWTLRRAILDIPGARSSHTVPTPRCGGIAVDLIVLSALVLIQFTTHKMEWPVVLPYAVSGLLIAAVSLRDDLKPLPRKTRFATHFVAALAVVLAAGGLTHLGATAVPVALGSVVGVFWMVGLTNAYNFMDGIDGIAGVQAIAAGVGWAVVGWIFGDVFAATVGALLAGSTAGFLIHNWPPARIFMGDVGSAFLGFSFATIPVIRQRGEFEFCGVLFVWPFLFDTTITLVRRLRRRENIFLAHRSHLYQRLVIAGYTHRFVTLLYLGLAIAGVIGALLGVSFPSFKISIIAALLGIGIALWRFVVAVETRIRRGAVASPPTRV